jgi:hypothetical protein
MALAELLREEPLAALELSSSPHLELDGSTLLDGGASKSGVRQVEDVGLRALCGLPV